MRNPDVIVVGGGQAGLVMSRSLIAQGIDHIVLERGRIGERWHSERWRSLNLLTTNAQSALPGLPHAGDPEAYMSASAFASYLARYAHTLGAPIISGIEVTCVEPISCGYRVSTSAGQWRTRAVIIATGACDAPFRPSTAAALSSSILQISPNDYREAAQLPQGGVLVVGASATGAQLAEEIHRSGRPVVLAVGDHTPAPRRYRGRDIFDQLEMAGILDEPYLGSLASARRQPSLQLVGRPDHRDLNLGILVRQGIRLTGRFAAVDNTKIRFAGDLAQTLSRSHARMERTLEKIDAAIEQRGTQYPIADPAARAPFQAVSDELTLDLRRQGIRTIVWATGYARRYPWLKVPVLDECGEVIHRGGVTSAPGLYILGLVCLRRRRSSFINGCALDADDLASMVGAHLSHRLAKVA